MIPPNILIISCLTILVYGEQYTNLDYNEPTSSSIENEMKVTEQSFSLLNLKETTKPFPVNNDLKDAPPESANQDYINESSEVQENLFITVDDMESTGTEYRIPVTNLYSMSSSALDYTISEEARLGAENFNEKSTTSTTPKTTTSQIKEAPLVTLTPTTRVSTKSSSASPRIKMGKTIKTYKSSADQVLRQFVENSYLRHPVACIIDTTESNLRKAQMLWNATLRSNAPLDILLSGYNSTGIGGIYSFKNTKTLLTGLSSMKESSQTTESGKAFNAILKASELIPYDSAIFLSTDTDPTDFEKFGRAATVLIKKRIRLYLIWFGETSFEENETSERQGRTGGKLGELSLSTGGEILHIPNDALDKNGDLGLITLFARTGIQEMLDYEIPVVEPPTIQPLFTTKSPVPVQSTPIFEPISEFFVNGD